VAVKKLRDLVKQQIKQDVRLSKKASEGLFSPQSLREEDCTTSRESLRGQSLSKCDNSSHQVNKNKPSSSILPGKKAPPKKDLADKISARLMGANTPMSNQPSTRRREQTLSMDKQQVSTTAVSGSARECTSKVSRNKSEAHFGLRSSRLPDIGSIKGLKELKLRKTVVSSKHMFTQRGHV